MTEEEKEMLIEMLDAFSPEDRVKIFQEYCGLCGNRDTWCECMSDDE